MRPAWADRIFGSLAGIAGFLGVAFAAYATHAAEPGFLDTVSRFLLFHAPVLVAVILAARTGFAAPLLARVAGLLMLVGLALFCGDLTVRTFAGHPLFAMAAPTGGTTLMAGWLLFAASCLRGGRE